MEHRSSTQVSENANMQNGDTQFTWYPVARTEFSYIATEVTITRAVWLLFCKSIIGCL